MKIASTKQRILQFVEYKQITKQEFYRKTGLNRGVLDADKLNQSIDDIKVATIIACFPELSIDWLITGKGPMLKEDVQARGLSLHEPVSPYLSGTDKTKNIPLIPVSAIAGFTNGDVSVLDKDVIDYYSIPEFEDKADFLVHVTGDSMTPLLQHGNLIACKKIYDSHFIQWGKVHLLDTSQGPVVKRLYQDQDAAALLCVSENNDLYPPFKMLRSEVRSLFIVVGIVKSL